MKKKIINAVEKVENVIYSDKWQNITIGVIVSYFVYCLI